MDRVAQHWKERRLRLLLPPRGTAGEFVSGCEEGQQYMKKERIKRRTTLMDGQDNRLLLERYLAGRLDAEQEYEMRHEDVVIDMPQSLPVRNDWRTVSVV
jgi:hypothetical protein